MGSPPADTAVYYFSRNWQDNFSTYFPKLKSMEKVVNSLAL